MVLLSILLLLAAPEAAARRFALIVGANDGGPSRPRLRYAASDADAMARVMSELGGVAEANRLLLLDATEASMRGALDQMRQRLLGAAGARRELLVYYSGHSDEDGLLLGGGRIGYQELRAALSTMPSDVRIAILDSCASGALLRGKGGQRRQAFLLDASATPKGHAFITSSSADEASQESDRIGGSFFTHYLVSGLRGAADTSGDKRVTLNEAYQYAFSETLHRTERTQSGPQHASYDIQLAGSGDLVFTDVSSTKAGLVFDPNVSGRLFVRDADDRLVVELYKNRGKIVELGLPRGDYRVTNEGSSAVSAAKVALSDGGRVTLDEAAFIPVEREVTARRGDEPAASAPVGEEHFAVAALITPISTGGALSITHLSAQLLFGRVLELNGLALGFGVNDVTERSRGVATAMIGNIAGEQMGVQWSLVFNVTRRRLAGAQLTTGVNIARGPSHGAQLAHIANYAEDLTGAQIAPVNLAGAIRGVQIGLVNVAGENSGFQLGLVNIAKSSSGEQLGLFSYSGNVPLRFQLYWSDVNAFNGAFRYGSRVLYGVILGGVQPFYGSVRGNYGLGVGLHGDFSRFNVDFDVSANQLLRGPAAFTQPAFFGQARLMFGFAFFERFMPFVGGTANVGVYGGNPARTDDFFGGLSVFRSPQKIDGSDPYRFWFGAIAGVQF